MILIVKKRGVMAKCSQQPATYRNRVGNETPDDNKRELRVTTIRLE